MEWDPIAEPPVSGLILKKLSQISRVLIDSSHDFADKNGLMDGKAGIALFLFYYAGLRGEKKYADFAAELFSGIFSDINDGFNDFRFSSGLAGIAWCLQHLVQYHLIDVDAGELLDDLDPFFHRAMIDGFRERYYDYLHGALGVGTYWLSRVRHAGTQNYLSDCIDQLDRITHSVLDPNSPKGVNLGVAHGIPSIIAFLSKSLELGISNNKTRDLLNRFVYYLLDQSLDPAQFRSVFPDSVRVNRAPSNSRLAWCYGDLGIGSVLWQASQVVGNKEWEEKAIHILIQTTERRALQKNLVVDACFCHGTAGIMHIYNRMYRYTGMDAFKDAAHYWLDRTLKMAVHDDGAAGYKIWCGDNVWQNRYCLLDGIAGIGMALMASVSDVEPSWDRCFFLG